MEQLPPGFRFYPTEEELITFYLQNKLHGDRPDLDQVIPSVNIYNFEPSQLPGLARRRCHRDMEQWFFFVPQHEREARGGRPNRTTASGYWKATGSPSHVFSSQNKIIGVKKTMVFYKGKAPTGRKTKWKMNEYKTIINQEDVNVSSNNNNNNNASFSTITTNPKLRHELSLCRVYVTSGCARAFDRRPPGTMLNISNNNIASQDSGRTSQNVDASSLMLMERSSSSTDSSNVTQGEMIKGPSN